MAVDRSRLKARASAGDAGAHRALGITRRTSFMLSGAQLGITVTGLIVGYVAEPLIGDGIGELLGGVGVPTGVGVGVGTVLALLFATVVQMVFGELFPKNLAIARPEPVARALALSTAIYLRAFGWLIWLFDQASNLLLKALRIEPVHDVEHAATPRDLEAIIDRVPRQRRPPTGAVDAARPRPGLHRRHRPRGDDPPAAGRDGVSRGDRRSPGRADGVGALRATRWCRTRTRGLARTAPRRSRGSSSAR